MGGKVERGMGRGMRWWSDVVVAAFAIFSRLLI